MRVVVCGAGIAGLATAARLQRHQHDVMVVERGPATRSGGYMIDFAGSGFDEAERLGLLPELEALHYPMRNLVIVGPTGRAIARLPYATIRRRWFGQRHFNFLRGDLEHVLLQHVSPGTVQYGLTIWSITPSETNVRVGLSDGTSVDADLLIGADGIHSRVRALAFGPEEQFVHSLGYEAAAFLVEHSSQRPAGGNFVTLNVPGREVAMYPTREGLATFFMRRSWSRRAATATACQRLTRGYGDLGWVVPELLRECARAPHVYIDDVAQVNMPTWYRGRVVLVGDACGCVSLLGGSGASLALVGGTALADALATTATIEQGLAAYQKRIKPMVQRQQRVGRTMARWFVPDTPMRLALRNIFLRASLTPMLAPLVRRQMAG